MYNHWNIAILLFLRRACLRVRRSSVKPIFPPYISKSVVDSAGTAGGNGPVGEKKSAPRIQYAQWILKKNWYKMETE